MLNDIENARKDGIDPHLWRMVAQISERLENAEPIAWSTNGMVQFLCTYPDGSNALVEWTFSKQDLMDYIERSSDVQRAQFVNRAVQALSSVTSEREGLKILPEGIKHIGFIPRPISKIDIKIT